MLHRAIRDIRGDDIFARDGALGAVDDVYFDDERWAVRYLVIDTGTWLPGRKVLISPAAVLPVQPRADGIRVNLTRAQIENAPGIDDDPPISREMEVAYARYFGWPSYWLGPHLWGIAPQPLAGQLPVAAPVDAAAAADAAAEAEGHAEESHLRSGREVVGYAVRATDGELGVIDDLLVDDQSWAVDGVVVDTTRWLPGGHVRISPSAITAIDWTRRQVGVRLTRAEVERSPRAS